MARIHPNDPCPCGQGDKYKRCCGVFHGGALAPTARQLMMSRYAAYAAGEAAYILATTDPQGPMWEADAAAWTASVRRFCDNTRFCGLVVRSFAEEGDAATVSFAATLEQRGKRFVMEETSRFRRDQGRWLYTDGVQR